MDQYNQLVPYLQQQNIPGITGGINDMIRALLAGNAQRDNITQAAQPAMQTPQPGQQPVNLPNPQPNVTSPNRQAMPALTTVPPRNPYGTTDFSRTGW